VQLQEDFESCAFTVCNPSMEKQVKAAMVRNFEALFGKRFSSLNALFCTCSSQNRHNGHDQTVEKG